jgi:hypothetical protein
MEYTPYARQLRGRDPEKEAAIMAFFEDMIEKIDMKKRILELLRDKFGMVYPDDLRTP